VIERRRQDKVPSHRKPNFEGYMYIHDSFSMNAEVFDWKVLTFLSEKAFKDAYSVPYR
jgi:hypothetical protein